MEAQQKELSAYFSKYFTAFCLSKAILEDYAAVIAKVEGCKPEEVKERVEKRMNEIAVETRKQFPEK